MDYLETVIKLPPGPVPEDALGAVLRLAFDDWHWFSPTRVGRVRPDQPILRGETVADALRRVDTSSGWLAIGGKGDRDVLLVHGDRRGESTWLGRLLWLTSPSQASDDGWRDRHADQVARLMRTLNSAYAYAGIQSDNRTKTHREATDERGLTIETFTVRDYSEGLAGIFWRNFFGPAFSDLLGDPLKRLGRDLDGIWLVEAYTDPADGHTESGREREAELIASLGGDAFYDHQLDQLPTRRPRL